MKGRKFVAGLAFGVFSSFLLSPWVGCADVNSEMNNFFNKFGSSANVSSAEVYNGQKAGYATGGGIVIRNRVMDTRVAQVQMPKFDAGCGGIDVYSGGFSFVTGDELVQTMKSIGSASTSYAFLLGLEIVSPTIANEVKMLQTWINEINGLNINSCEMGSLLAGSVWPKDTEAKQQICRVAGGKSGKLQDYVAGRHQCSNELATQSGMTLAQSEDYPDLLGDEYNIAWEAIQKNEFLSHDVELAQMMMTLMGTVIVRKSDKQTEIIAFPAKAENSEFLKTLLEGGKADFYRCASDKVKCLYVSEVSTDISYENSWIGKVCGILERIKDKIIKDEELNSNEKEILMKTSLPLYKIINVLAAYRKGYCPIDIYAIASVVGQDILLTYLLDSVDTVKSAAEQLKRGQFYSSEIDAFLARLLRIDRKIRDYELVAKNRMEKEFFILEKMQMIEDKIASEIIVN